MTYVVLGLAALVWGVSGLIGARIIVNLWFSGPFRGLRPEKLDAGYVLIGIFGGPINLLLALGWYLMGMGEEGGR